jgi:ribosomal protein S18 acetylase RimI-like enzyme
MIESLDAAGAVRARSELVALLADAVSSGASVGFLPPLDAGEAAAYWDSVVAALRDGSRVLLIARDPAAGIGGSVQLELAMRANARHRAEVTKLMVHRAARRRGIGRALMLAIEAEARRLGRTTLVLDTREGDPSERLYQALGWERAGTIPRYARSAGGTLDATAIYYRILAPA